MVSVFIDCTPSSITIYNFLNIAHDIGTCYEWQADSMHEHMLGAVPACDEEIVNKK